MSRKAALCAIIHFLHKHIESSSDLIAKSVCSLFLCLMMDLLGSILKSMDAPPTTEVDKKAKGKLIFIP